MKMKFLSIVTMLCLSVPAVADVSDKGAVVTASSPEATWELQFPKGGWELKKNNEKGGTYKYTFDSSRKSVTQLSLEFEPAKSCKTSEQCRTEHWKMASFVMKMSGSAPTDVSMLEVNGFSVVKYFQKRKIEDKTINILNYDALFTKDNAKVWINIMGLIRAPEDEQALEEILKGFQIKDKK